MRKAKILILHLAKFLGLFELARYITRSQLRIICWHGFSSDDECAWEPGIMLAPEILEQRLKSIVNKYTLLTLDAAVTALESKSLPENALVITLDDGFRGTLTLAHPLFKKYNVPYTLYLTTYYLNKDIQIINLIINYALWKTKLSTVSCVIENKERIFNITNGEEHKELYNLLFNKIDNLKNMEEKKSALKDLLLRLDLDADEILSREWLKIINVEQLQTLHNEGADIQLHTHRHAFSDNDDVLCEDIKENMTIIKNSIGKDAFHMCYPSGAYRVSALDRLKSLGVKSGTTCNIGLNNYEEDLLLLNRYLDVGDSHQIEFEANISGFIPLIKNIIRKII